MKKQILFTLTAILLFFNAFAGGGWTEEKGNGYFKLSALYIKADSHFTSKWGETDPNITLGFLNTSAYFEYGITDKWTLIGNIGLFARNFSNELVSQVTGEVVTPGAAINGLGDMDIAIKYSILKKERVALAGTFLLGIPTGKTGKGEMGILQLGDGEFNQMIRFDASTPINLKNASLYANSYVAFNHRTNGFSEEFRWGLEFGAGFIKNHLWAIIRLDGLHSLKNGVSVVDQASAGTSLFANNAEFIGYNVEIAAEIYKGFGVSFNYGSAFRAKLILASPIYTAGIFYDLERKKKKE